MYITLVKLIEFRNYQALTFRPNERLTVLCGENAQGKTNILEAVYMCAAGRSHRTSKDSQVVGFGAQGAYVRTDVQRGSNRSIELRITRDKGKQIKLDGAPISRMGELMGCLNAVIFSPEDLRLVKDGPSERRRFMDIELSQTSPAYFYMLSDYIRALNHRNALLKRVLAGKEELSSLETWDERLALSGAQIYICRREFVRDMDAAAAEIHREISGNDEKLSAQYGSDIAADDEKSAYDALTRLFYDNRIEDIKRGVTGKGPHRDDVIIKLNGRDARAFASQGQQRTAALSLKISELELMTRITGEKPILLLDDVMSELDEGRQSALFKASSRYQTLLTRTGLPDSADGDVYEVTAGTLKKL